MNRFRLFTLEELTDLRYGILQLDMGPNRAALLKEIDRALLDNARSAARDSDTSVLRT